MTRHASIGAYEVRIGDAPATPALEPLWAWVFPELRAHLEAGGEVEHWTLTVRGAALLASGYREIWRRRTQHHEAQEAL